MAKATRIICAMALLALAAACSTYERQSTRPEIGGTLNSEDQGTISPNVWAPTEWSGKNAARVTLPTKDGGAPVVAEIIGAKEQSSIQMSYKPETGEVSYSATDVRGLDAQNFPLQADAALAESLGELWTNLAPEIKTGVLCSLGLAFGVPSVCGGG